MREIETNTKTIKRDKLYEQYNWFQQAFLPSVQNASNEFFSDFFSFQLISVSQNINILFQGDDYFVTKIRLDKQHDVFFRCSSDTIKIVLDKILGSTKSKTKSFNLSDISELEAKIISSFNDYMYNSIAGFLLPTLPKTQKRRNFDAIHLTFFIKDKQSEESGKIIISLPQVLLSPTAVQSEGKFDITDFKSSKLAVNIRVGTTKFSLKELKSLEKEDIVVFENSNIHTMKLIYENYKKDFKTTPNPGLMTSIDNGGNSMTEENSLSQNLWDNIQVEMGAEFEKVKITLGELKNIEQGLVVDISSVYDNRISLLVENKVIAKGELVIVNDRYGVRIDEVFASQKDHAEQIPQVSDNIEHEPEEILEEEPADNTDEEFDYSDFELDDQDI